MLKKWIPATIGRLPQAWLQTMNNERFNLLYFRELYENEGSYFLFKRLVLLHLNSLFPWKSPTDVITATRIYHS